MNPVIIKYPFDKTGRSPDNFVSQEEHEIPAEKKRAFVPQYGPFFSGSVKIITENGVELVPNVDFKCIRIYPDATVAVGQEVTTAIWITNQSVIGTVLVDYQVVGGNFSSSIEAIQSSINDLQLDNRNVEWENGVIGKPATYPPSPHLHTLSQVFGFEYLVDVLERIVQALLTGDAASHEILYARLRDIANQMQVDISAVNALIGELTEFMNAHILDRANPHQTTKAQVGLGSVNNYATANINEAIAGTSGALYMTPQADRAALVAYAFPKTGGVVNGSMTANTLNSMGVVYAGNGSAYLNTNGDLWGTIWGGSLSSYLWNNFQPKTASGSTIVRKGLRGFVVLKGGRWDPTMVPQNSFASGWGVEGSAPVDDYFYYHPLQAWNGSYWIDMT